MRAMLLGTILFAASPNLALAQAPSGELAPSAAPAPAAPATLSNDLRPTFVAQTPADRVASKLIGLTIQNGSNDTIGEIADVVLDESSTVKAWVVGVGGFLGIGTKYVAIDPSALKLARVNDTSLKATIETTKDQLRAAPEYIYLGKSKPADGKSSEGKSAETKAAEPRPTEPKAPETTGANKPE
ncbi:PRC-barrel domain-containing protein [Methylobacterium iners]|uniref:PRC-barrel domain-containing protein n=1 Tax=Methylobacterium iners TaxID=418707 RepID=A0ABQ4S5Y1_9HYPH|nr:PRC-barrel domain-containing protein [Methylobacterium iners]GJD97903.1 hypothetical protein OCOJLMKI_5142 [Methylobacterium iners]